MIQTNKKNNVVNLLCEIFSSEESEKKSQEKMITKVTQSFIIKWHSLVFS